MQVARIHSGDELLEKCLNGRAQTKQSVTQLFKIAVLHFESGQICDKIHEACLSYLEDNLSFDELQKLKNPEPTHGGILDEMAEEGH